MNVARPSRSAQPASQVARSRLRPAGRPCPAVRRADQRVRQVPAARIGAAADQPGPGEPGRGQQPGMVAGQHRHRARPRAADGDHDPAGPAGDIGAAHIAQVAADHPVARAQADQARRPHPPLGRGLGVRQREEPGDFRRAVRRLGPIPGQRHIGRIQLRHDTAAGEPLVGAQRAARHPGQSRRADTRYVRDGDRTPAYGSVGVHDLVSRERTNTRSAKPQQLAARVLTILRHLVDRLVEGPLGHTSDLGDHNAAKFRWHHPEHTR